MSSRITKEDLVLEIGDLLGIVAPKMSTGSTEPREIFDAVNARLGLGLPTGLTKPEMAKEIVKASGFPWHSDMESSGGTVTLSGLTAVRDAVRLFVE